LRRIFSEWVSGIECIDLDDGFPKFPERSTLIAEISGRDSIAAALLAADEVEADHILPTVAFVPPEYGDLSAYEKFVSMLSEHAAGPRILPAVRLSSPRLWSALSGRFLAALGSRFGVISPCVGCHLYLHALRIQLAKRLGVPWVVAGEREDNGAVSETNQEPWALGAYRSLAEEMGVELLLPLRSRTAEEKMGPLSDMDEIDEPALKCPLAGSDRNEEDEPMVHPEAVGSYLREFALPLARKVINCWVSGVSVDPLETAADILRSKKFKR